MLEDNKRHFNLVNRARKKAEQKFTWEIQANRYLSLYTKILDNLNFLS